MYENQINCLTKLINWQLFDYSFFVLILSIKPGVTTNYLIFINQYFTVFKYECFNYNKLYSKQKGFFGQNLD